MNRTELYYIPTHTNIYDNTMMTSDGVLLVLFCIFLMLAPWEILRFDDSSLVTLKVVKARTREKNNTTFCQNESKYRSVESNNKNIYLKYLSLNPRCRSFPSRASEKKKKKKK